MKWRRPKKVEYRDQIAYEHGEEYAISLLKAGEIMTFEATVYTCEAIAYAAPDDWANAVLDVAARYRAQLRIDAAAINEREELQ